MCSKSPRDGPPVAQGAMSAPEPTVTVVPLADAGITPDPANARRHNPRNLGVIETSMQTDGAGRSILVDQFGVTIAGAGALEAATHAGITHAAVIETDGERSDGCLRATRLAPSHADTR